MNIFYCFSVVVGEVGEVFDMGFEYGVVVWYGVVVYGVVVCMDVC